VWFRTLRSPFPKEPLWSTHLLKEPKERVRIVSPTEHLALTHVFDASYDALYRFHLLTGFRLGECVRLEKKMVHFAMGRITIAGKGGVVLHKPLSPAILSLLREVWADHPTHVFTYAAERTRDGRIEGQRYPITYNGWKTYWYRRRREAAATCPSLIDPTGKTSMRLHDTRHTMATNLQMATGDVRLVQRALGHAKVETTEKYAHVFDEHLHAGMEKGESEHYLPGLVRPEGKPVALLPPPTGTDDT
jgi:integrase